MRLQVGTWNVNGRAPPPELSLAPFINADRSPGIVVVGFQEIVPLTAGNVLSVESAALTAPWEILLDVALNGALCWPPAERARHCAGSC